MGLFMRRRRPIARMAAGAATAGVAYHMGKRHVEQGVVNEQATAAYAATQAGPAPGGAPSAQPPQYAPPPPPPTAEADAGPDSAAELEKLAQLHTSGALSDTEFTAAKAKILGL
jgi:hypothetical protein